MTKISVFLDDLRIGPHNDFDNSKIGWENWIIVRSVPVLKQLLILGIVENISIDHDLGMNSETGKENESGSDLVRWMIEKGHWPKGVITIHSQNLIKAQQMRDDISRFRPVEKETDIVTIRQEDWT